MKGSNHVREAAVSGGGQRPSTSDVVEGGCLGLEVGVWCGRLLAFSASLTDESCETMCIPDGSGLLDRAGDVVVGVAEFVGEQLDLVRRFADAIMDDCVASRGGESLLGGGRDEVELVDIAVGDATVHDEAWLRVLEGSNVAREEAGVHSLAHVDVHELGVEAKRLDAGLDLFDLWAADTSNLTLTNTISVEDDPGRVGASVCFLEGLETLSDTLV